MKILISERQYKLLTEQSSQPVKIGCHDYGSIPTYCGKLKLTKEHGDMIITQNRGKAKKDLINKLNNFIEKAKSEAGEYSKITDKFTEAITDSKNQIITYLDTYYPSAVYSTVGIQKPLDTNKIMSDLVKILYDSFISVWNDSFIMKNTAKVFVTKNNIKMVKKEAKNMWDEWIQKFANLIDFYFLFNLELPVRDLVRDLNKSSSVPVCKKVIITADTSCLKLPSNKWYYPKMTYGYEYAFTSNPLSNDTLKSVGSIYWPKVDTLLTSLV
jgi:hypothetical protein